MLDLLAVPLKIVFGKLKWTASWKPHIFQSWKSRAREFRSGTIEPFRKSWQ